MKCTHLDEQNSHIEIFAIEPDTLPSYGFGTVKNELSDYADVELRWIKKTLDIKSWSSCTRGASKLYDCIGRDTG